MFKYITNTKKRNIRAVSITGISVLIAFDNEDYVYVERTLNGKLVSYTRQPAKKKRSVK